MDLREVKQRKLYRTFVGESRARNKYNLYAERQKEGYEWVAEIFDNTNK